MTGGGIVGELQRMQRGVYRLIASGGGVMLYLPPETSMKYVAEAEGGDIVDNYRSGWEKVVLNPHRGWTMKEPAPRFQEEPGAVGVHWPKEERAEGGVRFYGIGDRIIQAVRLEIETADGRTIRRYTGITGGGAADMIVRATGGGITFSRMLRDRWTGAPLSTQRFSESPYALWPEALKRSGLPYTILPYEPVPVYEY